MQEEKCADISRQEHHLNQHPDVTEASGSLVAALKMIMNSSEERAKIHKLVQERMTNNKDLLSEIDQLRRCEILTAEDYAVTINARA